MTEKINSLDYYLNQAKLINDYGIAVELIQKVIESSTVHSFSEFLEIPFFQTMKNDENYSQYYNVLELFSFGTFSDYTTKNFNYPELNKSALVKLKHLTIISIASKLDQLNNQLEIEFAIGRDVTDSQVDEILSVLDSWCKNCDIALKTIETQITQANAHKQKQQEKQAFIDLEVLNLKKSLKIQSQEVESMNLPKETKKSLKMKGARLSSGKSNSSVNK
ncbi:unnamed protein product [Brachionus calyciflorus]|uniref:COP9 signalosome complex subunit 7 helix I domain-containing protein n=1 Tax=Brachionus calyciflorus TaxID=104777 RepID=A0A813S2Y5_9BILA|nr:unnamed protein product [Brachionus calyciflorus]